MTNAKSPVAFRAIVVFLALSTVLMLIGQTTPIFDYDLAVRLGFQNGADRISEFGVQVIRAFCVSDTLVFIPLTVLSLMAAEGFSTETPLIVNGGSSRVLRFPVFRSISRNSIQSRIMM